MSVCAFLTLIIAFLQSYYIYRYANHSAQFVHAYGEGLTGAQAAWANKKYHGHCTLPPDMIREIKDSILPIRKFTLVLISNLSICVSYQFCSLDLRMKQDLST